MHRVNTFYSEAKWYSPHMDLNLYINGRHLGANTKVPRHPKCDI